MTLLYAVCYMYIERSIAVSCPKVLTCSMPASILYTKELEWTRNQKLTLCVLIDVLESPPPRYKSLIIQCHATDLSWSSVNAGLAVTHESSNSSLLPDADKVLIRPEPCLPIAPPPPFSIAAGPYSCGRTPEAFIVFITCLRLERLLSRAAQELVRTMTRSRRDMWTEGRANCHCCLKRER